MIALDKIPVLNPLTLRNTVGGELADMLEARGIENYEELIGIRDLRKKEKLTVRTLRKASEILENRDSCSLI